MHQTTYAIDQGNSFTKAAIFEGSALIDHLRVPHGEETALLDWIAQHRCRGGIVSSVRADNGQHLRDVLGNAAMPMHAGLTMPMEVCYGTPETLGVDRLANAVGALSVHLGPHILVIDCGSCLTVTYIENRALQGGSIAPGMRMRYAALAHFTGKLPLIEPTTQSVTLTGVDTKTSIQSGVQSGMLAEIQEIIQAYCSKINPLHVIVTGGDASYFVPRLKSPIFAEPFLTLMGLHEIYQLQIIPS
jgi:type III pantothenate kinase